MGSSPRLWGEAGKLHHACTAQEKLRGAERPAWVRKGAPGKLEAPDYLFVAHGRIRGPF